MLRKRDRYGDKADEAESDRFVVFGGRYDIEGMRTTTVFDLYVT
jgi:hypothetical protein